MAKENLVEPEVAVLVDDGFEQIELVEPRKALNQAGAETMRRAKRRSTRIRTARCTAAGMSLGQSSRAS